MQQADPLRLLPDLTDDLARVEDRLHAEVGSDLPFLTEVAAHLITAGGKRIRPGFAIAAAATAYTPTRPVHDDVIGGASAVELVHLGSLYHDDVMDDATTRRNVASVNAAWGNHRAILAGDFLLARASEIAAGLGTEVSQILASTIAALCEGQIRELQDNYNVDRTVRDYEASITGKTASLLAASCRIGALTGGVDRAGVEALTEFGHSYGMAFQIVDDILDVVATDEQLGKPSGNDLAEGNYTLPVINTMRNPGGDKLRAILGGPLTDEQWARAREIVRSDGGVAEALETAQAWADKAAGSLTSLPDNDAANALRAAGDHLVERVSAPII
ncbi:MAG: polyprenyl synthetase family protein [Acidimicrobiales bacterium]